MFPKAIGVVGKLHGLWVALEKCCKASLLCGSIVDVAVSFADFLSEKQAMRKFRAECIEPNELDAASFKPQPVHHID